MHPGAAAGHTINAFAANAIFPLSFTLNRVDIARSANDGAAPTSRKTTQSAGASNQRRPHKQPARTLRSQVPALRRHRQPDCTDRAASVHPLPIRAPKAPAVEAVLDAATTTSNQTDPTRHTSDRAATTRTSPRTDDGPAPTSHKARPVLRNANDALARRQHYRAEHGIHGPPAHDQIITSAAAPVADRFSARRCRSTDLTETPLLRGRPAPRGTGPGSHAAPFATWMQRAVASESLPRTTGADLLSLAVSGCRRITRESQRFADQRGEVRRCRGVTI